MTPSLVYNLKRRRLVSLMVLVLGLIAIAVVMVPGWEPAGPVFAEKVGDGVALVLVEPEESFRISWRTAGGLWDETEPFEGRVTATMGGDKLVVFHGLSYTTYAPSKDGPPENERWDRFTPGWSVLAAARVPKAEGAGPEAFAFGALDERTIASARLEGGAWAQGPELKRPGTVKELAAAGGPAGAWLWWRENGVAMGAPIGTAGWGEPRAFDVPAEARLLAAAAKDGPALFAVSDLKKSPVHVIQVAADGPRREFDVTKDPPFLAGIDSVSIADGDPPAIASVSGLAAGFALLDSDRSFDDLAHTLFRYRPGAYPWFMSMMFASLSIVGIGVSLLFERRKVTEDALVEQARLLSIVAPFFSRVFAASVDIGPFLWGFAWLAVESGAPPVLAWLGAVALCCGYCTACEAIWGQTLGKRLAGIAVKRKDGTPAGLGRILVRNMVRAVEIACPLLPAVLMISTKRTQRLGDVLAGTMVVKLENAPAAEGEEAS
ncbi:MAG: RDD family protein [Planctomycetes bacterium]|nr:RDD family protein [Planctomycetota bacterium]